MQAEHAHSGQPRASSTNGGTNGAGASARLGGARADFIGGLGRKVADLRSTLVRVRAKPVDSLTRDELRRKLHALGSAAKMMKFDAMDRALSEALGTLDRSPKDIALEEAHIDSLEQIIEDLPALAWGDGHARSSRTESVEKVAAQKYNVLVVGSPLIAEALLDDDRDAKSAATGNGASAMIPQRSTTFVCESTPDAQAAYDLVRTTEPDLVVIDADLQASTELVEALMDDPLTEAVPMIIVGSFLEPGEASRYVAMGVAKTVSKPTSREALRAMCEETLSPERGSITAHATLGDPTLEELGERLANEIREALVGRADPSARSRRISLGQGTEVLGAVWGAIARVREVVTSRSDGYIRFAAASGPEGALTPAPLLHEPEIARSDRTRSQKRGAAAEVQLTGRRVVIADDDPGVVWFLADLLKTAGCTVFEAFDGQQALELAYKNSPDLVISDILMPNLDGFSLCRALKRDVALRDTPVILLSWKEDLLQRVRELGAGAAGYVRKESDTRAIIARVREALRARGRIEARLREDGEVRGRLDGVSIRTLLEGVCATRPEARLSVRDATFLYEVEIRWGAPHRVTRTDGEGGFVKGPKVLSQLLGVSAGRFTVTTSTAAVEAELDGNLAAQLAKPIARARAAMTLLTSAQMHTVARVRLDEEALADYLKATPERARLVARRLANGAPPRELVLCGGCEPALLDDLLCDLAARGLVVGVEGIDGEDMLFPTITSLLQHTDTRASFVPRTGTPSPIPALADALGVIDAYACASDRSAPICTSPDPGAASSLEDAVLREMSHRSPEPSHSHTNGAPAPSSSSPVSLVDPQSLRPRNSPPPPSCEEVYGTPPADQIVALGEPTVIDDTIVYGERDRSQSVPPSANDASVSAAISVDVTMEPAGAANEANGDVVEDKRGDDLTPFASVMSDDELLAKQDETPRTAAKRKKWPMFAFVAATGIVAWAVLHFSTNPISLPRQQQRQAPAPESPLPTAPAPTSAKPSDTSNKEAQDQADEVYYTTVAAETTLPAGHGVIDVSAPADAIVLIDGTERPRGSTSLPPGNHDVRVRRAGASSATPAVAAPPTPTTTTASSNEERGCTIDVHARRVAHVKF